MAINEDGSTRIDQSMQHTDGSTNPPQTQDVTSSTQTDVVMDIRSRFLKLAVTQPLSEILSAMLDEAELRTGSQVGFLHYVEPDQITLSLQVWSTNTVKRMCKATSSGVHYSLDQAGVWVDCIRERKPVVHNDYASLPHRKGMPDGHVAIVRELVVPVMRGELVVAAVGVGNKPTDYDEHDVSVLCSLAELAYEIREIHQAIEDHRESEAQFKIAFQYSPIGMALISPDGKWLVINDRMSSILGYAEAELQSMTVSDITHPDELYSEHEKVKLLVNGELNNFQIAKRWIHKDGHLVWVMLSLSLEKNASGAPLYFSAQIEDITDQVLLEQTLRQSEETHRNILATAMDGFWLVDMQGKLVDVNESYCRMSGYDAQELLSLHVWDLTTVEAAEDTALHLHKIMAQGEDRFESRHRRKDGSIYFVEVCVRYRPVDGGCFIAFLRDITDRKHAEDALHKSEDAHRTLVNSLPDIVMRFDRQGRHLFVSENISNFVELQPAQIVGKTHRELGYSEKDCQFWEDSIFMVFDSGFPLEVEYNFEGPRGTVVRNWRIMPEHDAQGILSSVLTITRDITAQRQAERYYQTLFRVMIDGFALHDIICDEQGNPVDYRFVTVNPAFEMMTGLRAEDIIGRTALEVLPGTERYWIETYGKVAISGEPVIFENYSSALNKHFSVTAYQPAPNQFACTFADITDRKLVEKALKQSEEQFRGIIDTLPLAIYITSTTDITSVYVNPTMVSFFGYTIDEFPTLDDWMRLSFPDEHYREQVSDEWMKRYHQSIDEQRPFQPLETVVRCKDGSEKIVLWTYATLGDVNYFCGLNQTKMKRAEQDLRLSERRYAQALSATSDAIWEWNLVTNKTFYSHQWYQMLGYRDGEFEMTLAMWKELCHHDDFQPAFNRILEALKGAESDGFITDFRMMTKTGEWRWIQAKGNVVERDPLGKPVLISGINADITERKRAEIYRQMGMDMQHLLDAPGGTHEVLQRVLGLVRERTGFDAVAIRTLNDDDFPYEVHDGFSEEFLRTENSLVERTADGTICRDCDGRPSLECTCGLVISGKANPVLPFFTRGGSFWVNDSLPLLKLDSENDPRHHPRTKCILQGYSSIAIIPIRSKENIIGALQLNDQHKGCFSQESVEILEGIAIHIGTALARMQSEEILRASEERFRSYFTLPLHGVAINTPDKKWLDVNDQLCSLLGYTRDELAQMTWAEMTHPEDVAADVEQFDRMMSGEIEQYKLDKRYICKDGEVIWATISAGCVRRQDRSVEYTVCVINDITERKQAEVEKARLEEQLHHAMKMESVGRLAGGVAHDFNNMLGVIIGHGQMALEGVDQSEPIHEDLTEIISAAERSADLTRNLLAFARKQTVIPKVIDLNNTISGMLKMLQRLIGENIQLNWHPQSDLWKVKMDPSQVDQIMANLCVNARDAINDVGELTIETATVTIDEGDNTSHAGVLSGDYVKITVTDSGCGMDKETQTQIFEPFFTTKGVGEGTGLGLSTVYGAVKQNNGFVNVYSEPGEGTSFTIYLPRYAGIDEQVQTPQKLAQAVRGHETILLVEDEPAILRLTTAMLERSGYNVISATTPGEAIRLADEYAGRLDMVMTDVVMPEMNGRELVKNLLSMYPGMRRLFMSGYTADVIADRGRIDLGVHFIQKPFSMKELTAKVREVLDEE